MGRDVGDALQLSDRTPLETVREWGVRSSSNGSRSRLMPASKRPSSSTSFPPTTTTAGCWSR